MSREKEEITGTYVIEKMRWDNTAIATIRDTNNKVVTIKGPCEPEDLTPSTTYRFYGSFKPYTNPRTKVTEQQFHFTTFVKTAPHGRAGTISYLREVEGIGQKTAEKLYDTYGGNAVQTLREIPDVVCDTICMPHFTHEKARRAAEYLVEQKAMEGCTIDLIDALAGRGFPKVTARAAVAKWGNRAADVIKRCPYYLMAFRGCGFLKTDAMYCDLGKNPAALRRQGLCAWHFLATESSGNTWQPVAKVEEALRQKIGGTRVDPVSALRFAKRARMIATRRDEHGRLWIAEKKDADHEGRIAGYLAAARDWTCQWPDLASLDGISDHQRAELAAALRGSIAILGGAPGTGKTFTAAALIKTLVELIGEEWIGVAAPTGKAAVRVTENLQKYNLPVRARTIHSMLGVKKNDSTDGWSFEHNEGNVLPYRVIIIDESSMIDNGLMCSFLAAVAPGTLVLFVGDTNQLPPVGRGAPLRDMTTAGVPTGVLTEIRRNSGAIVRACHAIKDGKPFETSTRIDVNGDDPANLYLVQAGAPEHQIERMFAGIEAGRADGLNPIWDCQVLVGVNAKSKLSRKDLNRVLQERLNPHGEQAQGNPFRAGDKIVCLKNGFVEVDGEGGPQPQSFPPDPVETEEPETDDDGKVYVANGELAEVLRVEEKLTIAKLSNPLRIVKIPRGVAKGGEGDDGGKVGADGAGGSGDGAASDTGCSWDLGYALSCHKSQGSEWPLVLVMLDEYPGARMVCSREWLYTAISRAKRLCLLVGKMGTATGMCRRQALGLRKTFLVEEIRGAMTSAVTSTEVTTP